MRRPTLIKLNEIVRTIPAEHVQTFRKEIMQDNLSTLMILTGLLVLVESALWVIRDKLFGTGPAIVICIIFNLGAFICFFSQWLHHRKVPIGPKKVTTMLWLFRLYYMGMLAYGIAVVMISLPEYDVLYLYVVIIFAIAASMYLPTFFSIILYSGSATVLCILLWIATEDRATAFVKTVNIIIMVVFGCLFSHGVYQRRVKDFLNTRIIEEQNRLLSQMVELDLMTKLFNHETILRKLEEEIERVRRYQTPLSIMLFDLDNFKLVNDSYGHPSGDRILKKISEELGKSIRKTDIAGRYGGEEFLVIMPGIDLNDAANFAERFRAIIEKMDFGEYISITISGGLCQWTGETSSELVKCADRKLYIAKRSGKNRFEVE